MLVQRFREMAFVTRGVTIVFKDERDDREMTFYFEDGISAFVKYLNRNRDSVHTVIYAEKKVENMVVEFAMQYTDATASSEFYFTNTIVNAGGGSHQTGFRSAITRTLNDFARKSNLLKEKDTNLDSRDTLEGLTAIVSVKHPEPQFDSQNKYRLMSADAKTAVEQAGARDAERVSGTEPARRQADHREVFDLAARARSGAKPPANWCAARARSNPARCRANWRTAQSAIRSSASCISSRATRLAVRPNRAATGTSRRFCRCAARS